MAAKPSKRGTATDCRISIGLIGHHKTKRLIRSLGTDAAWRLVCLFVWATVNRPDGDLSGLRDDDLEAAVDWTGARGQLVAALLDSGFIDGATGAYRIHDWAEHNPWAASAGARSDSASRAATKRWADAKSCGPHAQRMRDAQKRNAPSPYPSLNSGLPEQACALDELPTEY